jgi:hypothetical protein
LIDEKIIFKKASEHVDASGTLRIKELPYKNETGNMGGKT